MKSASALGDSSDDRSTDAVAEGAFPVPLSLCIHLQNVSEKLQLSLASSLLEWAAQEWWLPPKSTSPRKRTWIMQAF